MLTCAMKECRLLFRVLLLVLLVLTSTWAVADRQSTRRLSKDTITVNVWKWGELPTGRLVQSAYPVRLSVKGRSLRVTSKYEQVLPIYTHTGSLYVAMQLSPGVNWLNGLPRGRYRINNRTISIK